MPEDEKRAAMADIISAKCSSCGHVVKVPVALGGKKAKCPKCAFVITIPTQPDPAGEFIPDDQLPEVARDEDILQGLPVEEGDEIVEGEAVEEAPTASRLRSMTPRRGTPTGGASGRGRTSGGYTKVSARGVHAPPARSSAAPVVIGVVIAAAAIAVVLVVALGGSPGGKKGKDQEKTAPPPPPPVTTEDVTLQKRCLEYISAFNGGKMIEILKFHSYGSPAEEQKIKASISALLEQGTRYDDVGFKSTSAAGGTVTFVHAKGERTLTWKQVDGVWLIAGP